MATLSENNLVIGWASIYIPEEIIHAAGFLPYRITPSSKPISFANSCLAGNLSYHVMATLDAALSGEYDFLSGVVIPNSDDAMRRLYDAWRFYVKTPFIHLLDIPKIITTESGKYFSLCVYSFIKAIEDHYRMKIKEESIKVSIEIYNETRHLLCQLYDLRKGDSPPVTGVQVAKILKDAQRSLKEEFNKKLTSILIELRSKQTAYKDKGPRIMLTGGYIDQEKLVETVEDSGAQVVCEDLCTGFQYCQNIVNSNMDPITALAKRYLSIQSSRMVDINGRCKYLFKLVKDFNIDGIIYYSPKFYDSNLFEFPFLKKRFNEAGIPILFLEDEHGLVNSGQIKTRVQAFLEII